MDEERGESTDAKVKGQVEKRRLFFFVPQSTELQTCLCFIRSQRHLSLRLPRCTTTYGDVRFSSGHSRTAQPQFFTLSFQYLNNKRYSVTLLLFRFPKYERCWVAALSGGTCVCMFVCTLFGIAKTSLALLYHVVCRKVRHLMFFVPSLVLLPLFSPNCDRVLGRFL